MCYQMHSEMMRQCEGGAKVEQLKELIAPVVEWLKKNGNPHTQIIVEIDCVKVTEDVFGFPVENSD